jgi:hypothetical protein
MASSEVHLCIFRGIKNMAATDTRSLQQIKRETEQTRAGLTQTVEQLRTSVTDTANDIRERISPAHIKAEVSDYIRSRGEQWLDDITTAARKNPMQAVAVGASVAYPLIRMARAIPVPVLMMGAGLFLAGSSTGKAATQKVSDAASDLSDEVMRRTHDLRDQLGESASAAKSYATDRLDRLSDTVSQGANQVRSAAGMQVRGAAAMADTARASGSELQGKATSLASSLADRAAEAKDQGLRAAGSAADQGLRMAGSVADQGRRMAGSAADAAKDFAAGASEAGQKFVETARDSGLDAVRAVRERATDLSDRAGKTFFQTVEQNPLLVAGVGLLIGGLIASALPRSDLEDGLVGDASNAVKRRAQDAAAQGLDAAKSAASELYEQTTRQAEAEGLGPDGLSKAARDVGQRIRRVAEAAVTTAFEPSQQNQQSTAPGGNNNG